MDVEERLTRIEELAAELRTAAAQFAADPDVDDTDATRIGSALHALHDALDILEPLADGGDMIDDE